MANAEGVNFELERLAVDGDELVVSGHWHGVGGLRFVRPTLVADDRRILATLEHKPWAPLLDEPWTAAFPWADDDLDVSSLELAVAPQVTVALDTTPVDADRSSPQAPVPDAETLSARIDDLVHERDALQRRLADAELFARERERRVADETATIRDDAERARATADRDRDRALAQLAEAVDARSAAVRSRARMEISHDEALQAREVAESKLAAAAAERDAANAQRDEVLLAYRALQRSVAADRAKDDRADGRPGLSDEQGGADEGGAYEGGAYERGGDEGCAYEGGGDEGGDDEGGDDNRAEADPDAPIGVRTMPAARTVISDLQGPRATRTLAISKVDLWFIRVLALVAGSCFIVLLVSALLIFV